MNKERFKGYLAGILTMTLIFASIMVVAAQVQTRNVTITYGVSVNLHGQILDFDEDSRPFIMDGRTFLPVRAIADAVGLPVDFDAGTNTVILGRRDTRTPLQEAAPFFDRYPNQEWGHSNGGVSRVNAANMGALEYNDVLLFSRNRTSGGTQFSLHNLEGQFRFLSGYMGRVDGSAMRNITVNFIGDGRLLQSYDLIAADMPTSFNIFVEGVRQLRIEVEFPRSNAGERISYAIQGFLE